MIKENEILQTKVSAGKYTAPKIKVKELRKRSVICASTTFDLSNDEIGDGGEL